MRYFDENMLVTLRILAFIIGLSAGLAVFLFNARTVLAAPTLKGSDIIITGPTLTLGDLFDGLESNSAYALGPAPAPGEDMVLGPRTLYKIAVALDLPWRPSYAGQSVVVRSASTLVPDSLIKDVLRQALNKQLDRQGVSGPFEIALAGPAPSLVLPHGQPATVEVAELSFDRHSGRFETTLAAPSLEAPVRKATLRGQIKRLVRVPVLKNALRHGDVINMEDIEWIEIGQQELQHDIILQEENLADMTPRRMVHAGEPVRSFDVEQPKIVARGDVVSIVFQNGPLTLTTLGKALQNGAMGDLVRVANSASNRTLQAVVTGEKEVHVR